MPLPTRSAMKVIKATYKIPFNLNLHTCIYIQLFIYMLLCCCGTTTTTTTTTATTATLYAKDLEKQHFIHNHHHHHHRHRHRHAAAAVTATTANENWLAAEQNKKVLHSNSSTTITTTNDFESNIYSWTGAKMFPLPTQQRIEEEEEVQQQQQQQVAKPQDLWLSPVNMKKQQHGTTRHKTKSGLLIESNVEMDFSSSTIRSPSQSGPPPPPAPATLFKESVSYMAQEEDDELTETTASSLSLLSSSSSLPLLTSSLPSLSLWPSSTSATSVTRKRNRTPNQQHRKRNGRVGQRQKLQRNALRLLSSMNENHHLTTDLADANRRFSGGGSGGLFPQLFNVATRASITVNATCGQNGREEYCKLVDAYPHKKWATQCGVCNVHSSDMGKHRPIEAVLANTQLDDRWWQSPTLQNGHHFEYITITLDLKQVYQIFYVMLRSANSPRPASWILEKSIDGQNFVAWQYFGRSEADCQQRYGLPAQNGKYVFQNDSEVICTMQFSKPLPLENGELHVSLLKNRPGAMDQSDELMNFIRARFIRIRLQGMHSTANLDNSVYWQLDAQSLEKRSFYSLKQIRISGRLDCHGHADKTIELVEKYQQQLEYDGASSKIQCVCQHNTCADDCSECCPLFRDKSFRKGSTVQANECEICQCNGHAESCIYDDFLDTGICENCRNHTTGNECEFCSKGYYRPEGASLTEPCQPCECHMIGSGGNCQPDGGWCICKTGFQGKYCDECLPGYYGDDCQKCECDTRGTLPDSECSGICFCRQNVQGDTCNTCKPGFYDLSIANVDGCTSCWCSGLQVACTSAEISTLAFETLNDWLITDLKRTQTAQPTLDMDTNFLVYGMYELADVEAIYWQAPSGYLGNRLASYGSRLSVQVQWVTIRGDTSGKPTSGPNVILFGRNGLKIAYGDEQFSRGSSAIINITLEESGWYHVPSEVIDIKTRLRRTEYHGSPVTREQFLTVLSSLEALLIRAAYHTDQVETALERAVIYSGGTELGGHLSTRVERCFCPSGYTGLSCESCDFGYIRTYENSSNHQLMARCKPCPCNGHSNSCDLQSGGCGNCMHNTYGERCERCLRGFYGNPLQGTPNDCKPCACPLLVESNNFSPSCQLKSYAIMDINPMYGVVENSAYICTQCPQGYTGDHCEMCDDGYYGKPTEIGSSCSPCQCDGGPCNVITGECITCQGNTEGWHCERCKLGYWGNPSVGCDLCSCYANGSDSEYCDSTDGQCLCKPRFSGQKCDQCADGYTNRTNNCQPCDCDVNGAVDPFTCDPDVGQCFCKIGVTGLKCNECSDMFYGLQQQSIDGCLECQCSPVGSLSNVCDKRSGQCQCLSNVTGRRCDKCKAGHWNLTQNVGCHHCRCDASGSRSTECNPWTGQCDCRIGVGGQRCNECTDGFFGFSTEGCQRCAPCIGDGQVCDPLSGRCICPRFSKGLGCTQCVTGTWGWQPRLGCRECQCDRVGSIGQLCDTISGQCQCREGYAGRKCDSCAVGYFGYPECRRCNCNVDGSYVRPDGLIACDMNGQCPCKSLVVGLKCDTCMQSTFGLSSLNPEGCTRCYCFGRSAECKQSDWSWGRIRMAESRNLSVQYLRGDHHQQITSEFEYIVVIQMAGSRTYQEDAEIQHVNGLNLIPKSTGNVSIGSFTPLYYPLYFQLPPQFCGDRISSYGGNLYFTLLTEGASTPLERKVLFRYPLVQIHSHAKLILDFFEYESFEYSRNITHKVTLHESYWKLHQSGQMVDRPTLMTALQNIKHIFIRGSCFADSTEVILQNVYVDSAIFIYGSTNMIAKGVEMCKCPKRYDGLSCQDPGEGFYRWYNVTETEIIYIEEMIGRAAPCQCNGRSTQCDRETGECLNCQNNAGGKHCEQCAEGYYGDPNSVYDCQPCPCPETSRNFARGCTVWQGDVSCVCRPGYMGKLCDRCRPGFYGQPMLYDNSTCQPCNCNLDGVREDGCDPLTGQCFCKENVIGLKCNKCQMERHHLEEGGCKLCDNCTLLLLDYVELIGHKLRRGLHNMDLSGVPAPHLKVEEYEDSFNIINVHYHDYNSARKMLMSYDTEALMKLEVHAENQKFQNRKVVAIIGKRSQAIDVLAKDVDLLYTNLEALKAEIKDNIARLNNYGTEAYHLTLPIALQQAHFYLEAIKQHRESLEGVRTATSCAWHYFYKYGNDSDIAYDQKAKVEMFWRDLNHTNFRLSDIHLRVDHTIEQQIEIDDILEHIKNLKNLVIEDYTQIGELQFKIEDNLKKNVQHQVEAVIELNIERLEQLSADYQKMVKLRTLLNSSLDEDESIYREVKKHWLPKAEKHAQRLWERSNDYARQFQPTKNGARIAILASSAHKNISEAIKAARLAAAKATEQVYTAHNTLYPKSDLSVIEKAKMSLEKSNILKNDARQEIEDTQVLKERVKVHEDNVEAIKSRVMEAGIRTNNISSQMQNLQHSNARQLTVDSLNTATKISEEMRLISHRTHDLHRNIVNLRHKFDILEPDWEVKLGMAEENVSLTKTNIRLANISISYIEEQAIKERNEFDEWNKTMAEQLQQLRDKVARAKHAADGIKISIESAGMKCIRSYLPTSLGLTTSNTIKMSFALANRNGNSPLLYVQGMDGRYIALDLFKRHIRLLWNLGGSTAIITHPLDVQTRDPKYDDAWYHIEVNRTLNVATLLVRRMNNYGSLIPQQMVVGYSEMEFTRFFQTPEERIYLGGYPKLIRTKDLQLNPGLNVVVHKVEVDRRPLGTWNFVSTEGQCSGAMIGAQESIASSVARHFNGLGYAAVKKSRPRPYRKNLFALQMTFKTLDENALLFLAVDDKNNRSVSVTLSRGHIMFRIDYGDESKLEINTTHKYNTGKWVKIEAAREFVPKRGTENGMLRVNNERPVTGAPSLPIKSHMLPDLSKPIYYLGGVPPGFVSGTTKAPGADNPFLGCMMDIQVNGETYDPLESSAYYGVEPACKEIISKAGFTGQGYMELPAQSLRKRSNTAFVFRTLQNDCLLLLAAYPPEVQDDYDSKDIKGNYSITLRNGHLQVWLNSGRSFIKLSSNITLNDGEFHVINLIKNGRKFDLIIDDELQDTKSLVGTPTLISMPRDAGGLYIGGAPSYEEYMPLAPTFVKLEGAIRDVVFNNRTLNFNQALRFSNVQIGRNGPAMGSTNGLNDILLKTEPMIGKSFTASPEGCKRVGSYSYEPNAFKFGDVRYSYAQQQTPYRNYWQKNFQVSFDFRSFYPNGLIFLAAGLKEKHKHYLTLVLKDGHLLLIVRGRRREELPLHAKLNDGEWHHVMVQCFERKITMSVEIGRTDQKTSAQMKIPKRILASHHIYVGGLPEHPPKMPGELLMKIEPFKGCLRRFVIGNTTQDLARPGKHLNVGQCFPKVERGSYFPGDAYAIYKKNFQVGKYLELEMEFRTSELSGILLSISEPTGFPALSLELHNGNVIFSCDLGDGNPFRVASLLPDKYALCNNEWHNISALYDDEQIALRIDQMPAIMAVAAIQRIKGKVQTKSPLYIGGISDIASSGSLMSRENFKGCIRNVSIRNERRDWIDMDVLHNVLLSECLVTAHES